MAGSLGAETAGALVHRPSRRRRSPNEHARVDRGVLWPVLIAEALAIMGARHSSGTGSLVDRLLLAVSLPGHPTGQATYDIEVAPDQRPIVCLLWAQVIRCRSVWG